MLLDPERELLLNATGREESELPANTLEAIDNYRAASCRVGRTGPVQMEILLVLASMTGAIKQKTRVPNPHDDTAIGTTVKWLDGSRRLEGTFQGVCDEPMETYCNVWQMGDSDFPARIDGRELHVVEKTEKSGSPVVASEKTTVRNESDFEIDAEIQYESGGLITDAIFMGTTPSGRASVSVNGDTRTVALKNVSLRTKKVTGGMKAGTPVTVATEDGSTKHGEFVTMLENEMCRVWISEENESGQAERRDMIVPHDDVIIREPELALNG